MLKTVHKTCKTVVGNFVSRGGGSGELLYFLAEKFQERNSVLYNLLNGCLLFAATEYRLFLSMIYSDTILNSLVAVSFLMCMYSYGH